ncbi:hypothetical protein C8Q80DRAFT_861597 [Daedaleopsis nitida]|nr:hypothetical protein C8Q80DRAFT_861597 [Daedaleopsis nitida]
MDQIVGSWMDRLPQMSIIVRGFCHCTNEVGAPLMHVFAVILAFLSASFLVRYKLAGEPRYRARAGEDGGRVQADGNLSPEYVHRRVLCRERGRVAVAGVVDACAQAREANPEMKPRARGDVIVREIRLEGSVVYDVRCAYPYLEHTQSLLSRWPWTSVSFTAEQARRVAQRVRANAWEGRFRRRL